MTLNDRIELAYERGILKTGNHLQAIKSVTEEVEHMLMESPPAKEYTDPDGFVYRWKDAAAKLVSRTGKLFT